MLILTFGLFFGRPLGFNQDLVEQSHSILRTFSCGLHIGFVCFELSLADCGQYVARIFGGFWFLVPLVGLILEEGGLVLVVGVFGEGVLFDELSVGWCT